MTYHVPWLVPQGQRSNGLRKLPPPLPSRAKTKVKEQIAILVQHDILGMMGRKATIIIVPFCGSAWYLMLRLWNSETEWDLRALPENLEC
jgi:hypothetical protein